MEFFLSKLVPLFLYPVGLASTLLALGLAVGAGRPRLRRGLVVVALLVLWLGGNRWVALSLIRALETHHPALVTAPEADVIVVLGGATHVSPLPLPTGSSPDRLTYAARLYQRKAASHLLLTGGGVPWHEERWSEAERMAEILIATGVPSSALWLESNSRNTRENAVHSKVILSDKRARRVLLVTSALHMARAVRVFAKAGIETIPAPTDYIVGEGRWHHLWHANLATHALNLIPDADSMELTTRALKEYYGLAYYRARGWI